MLTTNIEIIVRGPTGEGIYSPLTGCRHTGITGQGTLTVCQSNDSRFLLVIAWMLCFRESLVYFLKLDRIFIAILIKNDV